MVKKTSMLDLLNKEFKQKKFTNKEFNLKYGQRTKGNHI